MKNKSKLRLNSRERQPMETELEKIEQRVEELSKLTKAERVEHYRQSFAGIVNSIIECAVCYVAMQKAGDDVSFVPAGLGAYYKKIVCGQMLPGVLNLDGTLRQKVATLPVQDQNDVLNGKRLPLVVVENGSTTIRNVDPKTLQPDQVKQLFANGYIRSEEEQRSYIESKSAKPVQVESLVAFRAGCVVINGVKFTKTQLKSILEQVG